MNELYAAIGRKQMTIEQQDVAYQNLLNVVAGIVSGDIDTSRVMVNLTDRTWIVADIGSRPPVPGTINGLPVCILAPSSPQVEVPTAPTV